jgi:two-component system, chemotaxis family, chemotaxis protein CheY
VTGAARRRGALSALVVDDSAAMRRHLAAALHRLHIRTVEAADGAAGWRLLQAHRFDLICTDVNMPRLDGLKLVSLVRSGGPHQRTPIVVITTEAAEEDRRRAEALGASGYLTKPVEGRDVEEAVRRLLGLG